MSIESEAIIRIESYVHDIGIMMVAQTICLVCIAICAVLVAVELFSSK